MKVKKIKFFIIFLLFIGYFFLAARPVPPETVLTSLWVSSLETDAQEIVSKPDETNRSVHEYLTPFTLGNRFGYVDPFGKFSINSLKNGNIYLGEKNWTEYETQPSSMEIKDMFNETLVNIENTRGYPVLLDNRVFILGSEQNELSEIDSNGSILWTYEYGAPITCIDVKAGLVLTGSLDGVIDILDSYGKRIFSFAPVGSRYGIILGCAISKNGSRIGIICGVDRQRFLFLERLGGGGEYRIIYHEFLETGFRRPVRILFIDEDRRIIFEREGGISCFNIKSRRGVFIPLDGEIAAVDNSGDNGLFFLIVSGTAQRNELIGIKLPEDKRLALYGNKDSYEMIFLRAGFTSDDVFLGRSGSRLIVGGGTTLISFHLEDK